MKSLPTSRYLRFLTIFMLGFPVFYLLMASFIYDLTSKGILSLVLSPLFYLSSIFWIATGFGFRKMRKWSWYTFGFAQVFVTYLNALNLVSYSLSQTKVEAFILTLLIQFYVFTVASREIRVPYLFPKIRWWESGIAGMSHIVVDVEQSEQGKSVGQILDINTRGCFVKCPKPFADFEKIRIKASVYGFDLDLPGVVVWNAGSTVTHPKGIGVKFYGLDRKRKKRLLAISKRFSKEKDSNSVIKPKSA